MEIYTRTSCFTTVKALLFVLFFLSPLLWIGNGGSVCAQNNVGVGTSNPDPSSILDLTSTNKGVLTPRIADTNSIASPARGLLVFFTPDSSFYYWEGPRYR